MDDYCQEKGFDKWFETSAKDNLNIETSIRYLIDEVIYYIHRFYLNKFSFFFLDYETYQ
jgi:hypothetical protein